MDNLQLSGRHVMVVGGTSGLGLATAQAAVLAGAHVYIASRDAERLEAALTVLGPAASGDTLDISDPSDVQAKFSRQARIDHLVVSAAVNAAGLVVTAPLETLKISMDSRFWGAIHAIRAAVPRMPPDGSVTLTSGMATLRPPAQQSIAAAAAGALEILARALALELAPIRVNVINPGPIHTPLLERALGGTPEAVESLAAKVPLRRVGAPQDFGYAALFAMTNPYLNGTTLHLDGAMPWA